MFQSSGNKQQQDPKQNPSLEELYLYHLIQQQHQQQQARVVSSAAQQVALMIPPQQPQTPMNAPPPLHHHGAQQLPSSLSQHSFISNPQPHILNMIASGATGSIPHSSQQQLLGAHRFPSQQLQAQHISAAAIHQHHMVEAERNRASILSGYVPPQQQQTTVSAATAASLSNRFHLASPTPDPARASLLMNAFHPPSHQMFASPRPGSSSVRDPADIEGEREKQNLQERMDKNRQDHTRIAALKQSLIKSVAAHEGECKRINKEIQQHKVDEVDDDDDEETGQDEAESLIDQIYAENRQKAAASHAATQHLAAGIEQRIDLEESYQRGLQLLPRLVAAMRIQRGRRQEQLQRNQEEYERNRQLWEQKIQRYENNPKKIARDAKSREIYEKMFIELKKSREERERSNRGLERSRISLSLSEGGAGFNNEVFESEEKVESCTEPENIDDRARSAAIIAPIPTTAPRRFCENRNGFVADPYEQAQKRYAFFQSAWTDAEKALFHEKILAYGKNFAAVAAFLPARSVKDCVYYYYMTKKLNNYKTKIKQKRKKVGRQYKPPVMPHFDDVPTEESLLYPLNLVRKEGIVKECLICDSRIVALDSLSQSFSHFEPFGLDGANRNPAFEFPICTKCNAMAQKNKATNRCPIVTCPLRTGKKRPVRIIPERFQNLDHEHKRFLIYRMKIPPSANKCCNSCCKRILKDIDALLNGELVEELEAFKNRHIKTDSSKKESSGSENVTQARRPFPRSMLEEEEPEDKFSPNEFMKSEPSVVNWDTEQVIEKQQELFTKFISIKEEEVHQQILDGFDAEQSVENAQGRKSVEVLEVKQERMNPQLPPTIYMPPNSSSLNQQKAVPQKGSITQGTPVQQDRSGGTSIIPLQARSDTSRTPNQGQQSREFLGKPSDQYQNTTQQTPQLSSMQDELAAHVLSMLEINPGSENASMELTQKLLERQDILSILQQPGILQQLGIALNNATPPTNSHSASKLTSFNTAITSIDRQQQNLTNQQQQPREGITEQQFLASTAIKRPYRQEKNSKSPIREFVKRKSGLATTALLSPSQAAQQQQQRTQQLLHQTSSSPHVSPIPLASSRSPNSSTSSQYPVPPLGDILLGSGPPSSADQFDVLRPSAASVPLTRIDSNPCSEEKSGIGGGAESISGLAGRSMTGESVYESLSSDEASDDEIRVLDSIKGSSFTTAEAKQPQHQDSATPFGFYSILDLPLQQQPNPLITAESVNPAAYPRQQQLTLPKIPPPTIHVPPLNVAAYGANQPGTSSFSAVIPQQQPKVELYEPISDDET